MAANLVII